MNGALRFALGKLQRKLNQGAEAGIRKNHLNSGA